MTNIPPFAGPPLNYQQPYYGPPMPPTRPVLQFFGGLGAGTLLSLVAWLGGFGLSKEGELMIVLMIIVPVAKLAAGITFLCLRPWRLLGGGILTSLALGFFIFFTACAMNVKF